MSSSRRGVETLKRLCASVCAGLFLLLACGAVESQAQVRRIRMKIDGYLCGA